MAGEEGNAQAAAPDILSLLSTWGNNFTTQTSKAFREMRTQDYIRLVTILGAYLLLRPYLMKLGAYMQMKQHEAGAQAGQDEGNNRAPGATLTANDLRGSRQPKQKKVEIPGVESDSEDENPGSKDDWGRPARLRQRKFIRQALEAHERKLREEAEADSDKDIEQFLVD